LIIGRQQPIYNCGLERDFEAVEKNKINPPNQRKI